MSCKTPNVTMRSEQLFVSTDQIRVTYHFFNKSDHAVTNLVAFPLPDITIADQDTNIAVPTEDPVNFLAFATTADGRKVETKVEQVKVLRQGRRADGAVAAARHSAGAAASGDLQGARRAAQGQVAIR